MKCSAEAAANEPAVSETALLSEVALAEDWKRPEEEAAWLPLQSVRPANEKG